MGDLYIQRHVYTAREGRDCQGMVITEQPIDTDQTMARDLELFMNIKINKLDSHIVWFMAF